MGGKTPDRFPGEREDEGLVLLENSDGDPTVVGGIRLTPGGSFKARDATGVFDLRTGGEPADFNNAILDVAGGFVYANDELIVTKT